MGGTAVAVSTAVLAVLALLGWLRSRLVVVDVDGTSMEPTYHPGDRVLVRRTRLTRVHRGDVVVVERPDRPESWMIKRAAAVPGDPVPPEVPVIASRVPAGQLIVLGDNAASSYDSRSCGFFPAAKVLGVVIRKMSD